MISVFKKGTPIQTGGAGDGSRENPWYWYQKTSGHTVDVNNDGTSGEDNHRLYFRVHLRGGVEYTMGQTTPGGEDGKIWLYDAAMSEIMSGDDEEVDIEGNGYTDGFTFEPAADGVYIIGAGTYSTEEDYTGNYTVAISPLPEVETIPNAALIYPTSSGFNAIGKPIKYRSADEAGIKILTIPTDGLIFHAPLRSNKSTAETGQGLTIPDDCTFGTYKGVDCTQLDNAGIESPVNCDFSNKQMTVCYGFNSSYTGTYTGHFAFDQTNTWQAFENRSFLTIKVNGSNPRVQIENFINNDAGYFRDGNWHYYAHVITDGHQKTFVDGNGYAESAFSGIAFPDGASTLYIGDSTDGDYMYGSRMADFRIYNRALSEDEIRALSKEFTV